MKKILIAFLFILGAMGAAAESRLSLDKIFSSVKNSSFATSTMTKELLNFAIQEGYNVFDLLNEAGLYLKARNLRITIMGNELREAAKSIRVGDTRVDTLFPINKLVYLSVGAKNGTDNEIEIRLTSEHSGYLELGDFFIEKVYGFQEIHEKKLENAFGIRVKSGMMSFDLDKVERVPDPNNAGSQNYIAIYLKMFPKAKRWLIEAVRLYSKQELITHP